jgi:soluble lytic murein transglycosylase
MATRYPQHEFAPRAVVRAAMVPVAAGRWREARGLLEPLTRRDNAEQWAARYWTARALAAEGAPAKAAELWRFIIDKAPDSYYALRAAERLDTVAWLPQADTGPGAAPGQLTDSDVAVAFDRIATLDQWGLSDEARDERADLVQSASRHAADARRVAARLLELELASPAMALAARVPALATSRRAEDQRLRFPLPYRTALATHAAAERLDLPFVAALIRQESRFTATARSGAGALGLMQLMPAVGRSLAAASGLRPWHDSLLFVPAINLRLGTRHLAAAMRREGTAHRAYALAAYNAGRSRVVRWRNGSGAARDWELFVERIPYEETRDYVRIVLRNEAWYRALYEE